MRLSQLKTDIEYATCDGQLVKVVGPVSNKWTHIPELNEAGEIKVDEHGRAKTTFGFLDEDSKEDPWAKCTTSYPYRRRVEKGVLVEYFRVDEDGKPTTYRGKNLIKAADIAGTWSDYMLLHANRVREQVRERTEQQKGVERAKVLQKRLDKSGLVFPQGETHRKHWREPNGKDDLVSAETSTARVTVTDAHRPSPAHPMFGKLPEDYPFYRLSLDIGARNERDIEYLFEVIEAGVKHLKSLEKRRAREAGYRAASGARRLKTASTKKKKPSGTSDVSEGSK